MNKLKIVLVALVAALVLSAQAHATTSTLSVQKVTATGKAASYSNSGLSTSTTYQFSNNGRTWVHFKKTGAGAATVSLPIPNTFAGYSVSTPTVNVPATTGDVFIGPFAAGIFNDASENVSFTVSDTAGLSFAVLSL